MSSAYGWPHSGGAYGVDATSTSYQRHGWDIHALYRGGSRAVGAHHQSRQPDRSAAAPGSRAEGHDRPHVIAHTVVDARRWHFDARMIVMESYVERLPLPG